MMKPHTIIALLLCLLIRPLAAQETDNAEWTEDDVAGLSFRSIGPAFMSGRIADIAIHPKNDSVWYVGVGSGGVWKTVNAGVTWKAIFDEQPSYSIGCITIDPSDPNRIWVGTGENVGGRHVGFGDGIYLSEDGGNNWKNMGLKDSQHLSKIIVHPSDSNLIWVASQGPLWNKGGERGLYKSMDGGQKWKRVLGDAEWIGVTDVAIDPRDSNQMYAATWQRHRTVAAYMGGGPGSGLHRSSDGGDTWEQLKSGLPESNMGKIGLALSSTNPDVLYAAIELDRRTGAVYRSSNRGATWQKMSDTISGGTGPHYYQELYASPHQFDRIYLADVRIQVSDDGGKTFRRLKEESKHSDNHAMAFRADDPNYLLVGSDGGLYESFDLAENWRFFDNLPVTQFYKIAIDDAKPFYNVYGGTQDNSTEGGPSRTANGHGIQNTDWRVVLDWDGHQPATEPGNPNIVYAERQEGFLSRLDMTTGEVVDIQPQPKADEDYERFNWDTPILVSPHNPTRLYVASHRVWRSNNRGDKWTAISGDLTRDQDRLDLPIMGSTQSWDNAWDISAMSNYNTITSLAESPQQEGLIYAGTDDGLIHVSENGGGNWRRIEVSAFPGVPARAFVNDIRADLFDSETVYVAMDNHKQGDFKPYLYVSHDRGQTWKSIVGNIPDRTLIWRTVQDHVQANLLFAATEFGIYFTVDGGVKWLKLKGGLPTISFRDIKIHRREDDLVVASFGRGIFILDDMGTLRELAAGKPKSAGTLFGTRRAWWYFERSHLGFDGGKGNQGASHFIAANPPFGATFTYHLSNDLKSKKETRNESEKPKEKRSATARFPGWDAVEAERREWEPKIWLTVKDSQGLVVRRIEGPAKKGLHRIAWDLNYPTPNVVKLVEPPPPMWGHLPTGLMAAPGRYTVTLSQQVDGTILELDGPREFEVLPLRSGALPSADPADVAKFWREYEDAVRTHSAIEVALEGTLVKIERMKEVMNNSTADVGTADERLHAIRAELKDIDERLNGNRSRLEPGEKIRPRITDRLFTVSLGVARSTYGATSTHRRMLNIANDQIRELYGQVNSAQEKLTALVIELHAAGAPWIEGEVLPSWNSRQRK
jgi:photosystem II stability/assembly factor-like uncharacterized protein